MLVLVPNPLYLEYLPPPLKSTGDIDVLPKPYVICLRTRAYGITNKSN